ncbi:MAG: hypothetical protein R2883_06920 [Caldisericia bacterium]
MLEDVSQVTNPGVADGYIVGWKGYESGRKSIFLYSTETGVTTLLPAYEEENTSK